MSRLRHPRLWQWSSGNGELDSNMRNVFLTSAQPVENTARLDYEMSEGC